MIHWDVPADSEMYVQESGRGVRDGKFSFVCLRSGQAVHYTAHDRLLSQHIRL